ncbi:MAG: FAD-dependent oxidoreductase [Acidimicrobiaceae bacterium]|nr:FAD-dependent oxidoreductase [Acidimicrobiaceae bacterium]MDE0607577.1 FAD-dependent oxidoreductase [Acidimicrobiaceae bacterium]
MAGLLPLGPALPDRAEVVVIGGGIVGCSIAYHLTRRGVSDVVLLEQGTLTCGTTWHAAGLVSQLKSTHSLTRLATYSARLFEELEDETGQATGYRTPGSISVADNEQRWEEILRGATMAEGVGVETRVIDLDEAIELWPLMRTDDLVGALYIPRDGQTSPVDTTMALAKGAKSRGARIIEGVSATDLRVADGKVAGVVTEQGEIETETVVLATGMWTRHLAARIGVNVPLQACEHFYIVTEPLDGMEIGTPTLRDPGNYTYFKEETGKLMAGFFEPRGKVWRTDQIPRDFSFGTLDEDWEHLGPIFERAIHRVPALGECGLQLFFNGPESFTPDGVYYMGEAPEVDGCFVAAGFNSVGIQSAGGVGWALADWIADRRPPMDLNSVDIRRALPFQAETDYLQDRISESLGLLYAMHWPFRQYESARGIRLSPLHDRIAAAGAVFGETAGWERPNWYARDGQAREYEYSYGKQNWHDNMVAECLGVREAVGLFDQTSFAKFTVSGPDALAVLNTVSVADIDAPIGKAVYTQWCNQAGGIEADLTVNRLGDDEFFVVTAAASEARDWAWLRRACRGKQVTLANITHEQAMIGLMGPQSRAVLSKLTDADLSNDGFEFGTGRTIDLAGFDVFALRMSYVGDLGWELYAANADAGGVYDALIEEGRPRGLVHAGYHAMNSLRLEAGMRHWGHDITDEDTPLEAGLGFTVAWDKTVDFNGRSALEAQRRQPRTKRLIQLRIEDPDLLTYHDEPLYRDGLVVGRISSSMWSATQNRCCAMGYVEHHEAVTKEWLDSGSWETNIASRRVPVSTSIRSWFDPANQRPKQ